LSANPYESERLLAEYLLFHYGTAEEILPPSAPAGMEEALDFAVRTTRHFSVGKVERTLDLGCAVGRSAYELSRSSKQTLGIDFSNSFVRAAAAMAEGPLAYQRLDEAHRKTDLLARLPEGLSVSRETTEQILAATDIVDVISSYISVERAGPSYKALCPFHNEKTPSFNINPVRQFFHCFGCGKSGDAITFLREYEKLTFRDALKKLAARAGIEMEKVLFETGDAMNLRPDLGDFDRVHAVNLLCRLTEPQKLLKRLPSLVRPGGELVIATPCTWLGEYTPPENWPEGSTLEWLKSALEVDFEFLKVADEPFLIRETARKFQWTRSMVTTWSRK
jgi:SAM-dependent methyltransferase